MTQLCTKHLDVCFLVPHHWIKFSHTITGGKYVDCCGHLLSIFLLFSESVYTAKEPEGASVGSGVHADN